jgi:hypothetical protein
MDNDRAEINSGSQIDFDHNIIFVTLSGEEISVRAKQIKVSFEHGTPRCEIRFEMDWQTYQQMFIGEWFGLFPAARGQGSENMFTANLPIEMKAVLRQSLTTALIERQDEAEDVLAYLLQKDTLVADIPVKSSESWLATEVKQQVELPDELIENGTLKKGYHTLWSGQLAREIALNSPTATMNETIEHYFNTAELQYERIDNQFLRLSIRGEQGTWVTLVRTDEEIHLCIVYSVYPQAVPAHKRTALAAFLIQENYDLPTGNFEMDLSDGELRFRSGINVGQGQFTTELFRQLITANISVMEHYYNLIGEEIG